MFRSKTVFVIGAGASCELKFPSGGELLEQIASVLKVTEDDFGRASLDPRIRQSITELAGQRDGRANESPFYQAAQKLERGAHLALSIDNLINQLSSDPCIAPVAKLAIADRLLEAERKSPLYIDPSELTLGDLSVLRNTWLGRFAQMLVQDVVPGQLAPLFENVTVISFNYDRSIQQFLPIAIASQFGIEEDGARDLCGKLRIYFPYGSLGELPRTTLFPSVAYGANRAAQLATVAQNIRTFTESTDDPGLLDGIRSSLSEAERVVFLGFGYHRQNMTLLTQGVKPSASRVYGTSLGLSPADQEAVKAQLGVFLREGFDQHFPPILQDMQCGKFLQENFRALTA